MSGAGRNCTELRVLSVDEKHSEVTDWGRDGRVRTRGVGTARGHDHQRQMAVSGSGRNLDWGNHEQEATSTEFGGQCG